MLVKSVSKLWRNPVGGALSDTFVAGWTPYGARVVWTDSARGVQDYVVTQVPNNITTADAAQSYFNTVTGTNPDMPDQTRLGVFFGCYAVAKVTSFVRGQSIDFEIVMSDDYLAPNFFG